MSYFRELSRMFYPESQAGITINNNEGDNQIRYDIEAKIHSDSSDGINSVKIFCYDLTLLFKGRKHIIDFVFHDSRLFSNIDEKHCSELFKIVKNRFQLNNKQYIASINQNQLNNLDAEVKSFITDNVVIELNDDDDSSKLLGMKVELDYD